MQDNDLSHPYGGHASRVSGLSIALDERDSRTQDHCDRVSGLCLELGRACGLSARELGLLRLAGGLHDIGKIGIPDAVLKKPGLFDDEDWAVMKTHPARGERIVLASELADGLDIAEVVRQHHERFDGQGYPDGISGESISILARIVALVDAYDAMARLRPHTIRRSHAEIVRELRREDGGQHDPFLVGKFSAFVDRSRFRIA